MKSAKNCKTLILSTLNGSVIKYGNINQTGLKKHISAIFDEKG